MASGAQKADRYRLLQPLGRGGQGHTYRAEDQETGRVVAVKVVELRGAGSWKPFDLFERECKTLEALDNPGIPKYLDRFAEEDEGKYYLVMELVEGRSLRELLDDGQLHSEAQLWNLLHQALEILRYLHDLRPPVIHRDIKPANLIRRPDGRLALVDFGGVRVALREEGGSTVVGTFGYMAPEQLHGEATPATDIYGLGATLATLATGTEADKLPRKGLKVDLRHVMPSSALRDLLSRMLEPDPEQRLPDVASVQEAIVVRRGGRREQTTGAGDSTATPSPARSPGPPPADEAVDDEDEQDGDSPLADVEGPLAIILRLVGMMGYVGLTVLDAVFLPLVFVMLGAVWSSQPEKLKQLKQRKQTVRRALRGGRQSMKALSGGRNPYRLRGPEPPRALPPARRGRGRKGRRGRGRRRL